MAVITLANKAIQELQHLRAKNNELAADPFTASCAGVDEGPFRRTVSIDDATDWLTEEVKKRNHVLVEERRPFGNRSHYRIYHDKGGFYIRQGKRAYHKTYVDHECDVILDAGRVVFYVLKVDYISRWARR